MNYLETGNSCLKLFSAIAQNLLWSWFNRHCLVMAICRRPSWTPETWPNGAVHILLRQQRHLEGGTPVSWSRLDFFLTAMMRHREVGHQSVGKIFLLWKTVKSPKNYSSKKNLYHPLPTEVRKAANCSEKVISDRNNLIIISNKISYVDSQSKLLFYHVI